MPLRGDLASFSLAEIFQFLSVNQSSGTLTVSDGESSRTLAFAAGVLTPVGEAQSYVPRLGEFLTKRQVISQAQLDQALATQKERGGGRLGEILVGEGIVTEKQIRQAVREKLEEEIYDLFLWKNAFFEFERSAAEADRNAAPTTDGEAPFEFNTSALLMEAVRRADEWGPISENVPTLRYIFVPATSAPLTLDSPESPLRADRVAPHLRSDASVREVIDAVGASKFDVCKTLDLLRRDGQIAPLPPAALGLAFDAALREGKFDAAARHFEYALDLGPEARDQRDRMLKALLGDRGVAAAPTPVRLTGRAEAIDRPTFVQLLLLRAIAGTIRVHDIESERVITLSSDSVTLWTTGARETPRLGRVLLANGAITQRQLDTALAIQRDDPRRIGEILVERGVCDEAAVLDGVLTKVVHELYDLFLWRNAFFEFTAGASAEPPSPPADARPVRLEVGSGPVHRELVERVTRAGEVLAKIASSRAIFRTTERGARPADRRRATHLSGDVVEQQVATLINGARSVHDILRLTGASASDVCESLAALLNQGRIQPLTADELRDGAQVALREGRIEACLKLCRYGSEVAPGDPVLEQVASDAAGRRTDAGEAGHEYRLDGDLESFSLAELVQSLYLNKHSGTLRVTDDRREKVIYFAQGTIALMTHGESDVGRVGDILVDMGLVTEHEIESTLEAAADTGKRVGERLVDAGLVTADDVQSAIATKVRDELFDVFLWKRARFEFLKNYFPDEFSDGESRGTRLSLDTTRTLMEAINRMERWEQLSATLHGRTAIWRTADEPDLDALSRRARSLLPRCDGRHTVEDIIEDTSLGRFAGLEALSECAAAGAIRPLTLDECNEFAEAAFAEREFERCVKYYEYALQIDTDNAQMRTVLEQVRTNVASLESGRVRMKPFDLVKLFRLVINGPHTGTLTARDGESVRQVYLGRDEIVVASRGPRHTPDRWAVLLQDGTLTERALSRGREMAERTKRPLEEVLLKQGACTTADLAEADRRRVWNEVEDLFAWKEASIEFDRNAFPPELEQPEPGGTCETLETDVRRLLEQLTERREQWERFRDVVGTERLIYQPSPRDAASAPLLRRHKENPVLPYCDGRTPVRMLPELAGRTEFDTWHALHDLVTGAVIQPLTASEAAAAADAAWVFRDLTACEAFYRHAIEVDRGNPEWGEKLALAMQGRETSMRRRISAEFATDRDVASLLETVRKENRWGTLEVTVEDRIRMWHLQPDALFLVAMGGVRGRRIGERLVEWGVARQSQIDKALRSQERTPRLLGEILVLSGVLSESSRDHLVMEKVFEDLHEVLSWRGVRVRFREGDPPAELTDPARKVTVVHGKTGELLDAALAREAVWAQVAAAIPSAQAIFVRRDQRTGDTRLDARNPVLPLVDGVRSVSEICAAARISRYEATSAFFKLLRNDVIGLLSADECRRRAEEAYMQGDLDRALTLYRYASELDPEDERLRQRVQRITTTLERQTP